LCPANRLSVPLQVSQTDNRLNPALKWSGFFSGKIPSVRLAGLVEVLHRHIQKRLANDIVDSRRLNLQRSGDAAAAAR
jgi:hypothetical protein